MNSLAQAEIPPGLRGAVVEVVKALAPDWDGAYPQPVFGIPWEALRAAHVRIPSGADSSDTLDVGETMDSIANPRDEALSAALGRSFLTAVDRQDWANWTADDAPRVDLESLDRDEILFRVRDLEDFVLLTPDDQLTSPSLMLQRLSAPGRADILKVRPRGRWSTTSTGSCSGLTGPCLPGPLGCCQWLPASENGRTTGWMCDCPDDQQ